jgi:hypothetical protein
LEVDSQQDRVIRAQVIGLFHAWVVAHLDSCPTGWVLRLRAIQPAASRIVRGSADLATQSTAGAGWPAARPVAPEGRPELEIAGHGQEPRVAPRSRHCVSANAERHEVRAREVVPCPAGEAVRFACEPAGAR